MTDQTTIRVLKEAEVGELINWAKAEGWNPGLDDAAAFHAADNQGFLGCFVGETFAAGISCVTYGQDFGFIGFYITRPDLRGRGYGLQVWKAAMERLEGRKVGLDGVPEQQDNYASMGFAKAYETARWSGYCKFRKDVGVYQVLEIDAEQLDSVAAYEQGLFPAPRSGFLEKWLSPPRSAFAVMKNGKIAGYAVLRECNEGSKLGPVFADTQEDALMLLSAAMNACAGAELHIDVPVQQSRFSDFLKKQNFTKGFETARMYKDGQPESDMSKIFAVTSLELG